MTIMDIGTLSLLLNIVFKFKLSKEGRKVLKYNIEMEAK